jgi:hypothetical protein
MPIDKWTAVIRSEGLTKKTAVKIFVIAFLILAIGAYAVIKSGAIYSTLVNFTLLLGRGF